LAANFLSSSITKILIKMDQRSTEESQK